MELHVLINERDRAEFLKKFEPKIRLHELQKYELQSIIGPSLLLFKHVNYTDKL